MKTILFLAICLIGFSSYSQQSEEIEYFHDEIIGNWNMNEFQLAGASDWIVPSVTEQVYISRDHIYGMWDSNYSIFSLGIIFTDSSVSIRVYFISENCIRFEFEDGSKIKLCR